MRSVPILLRGLVMACTLVLALHGRAQPLTVNAGPASITLCSNAQATLGGNPTATGGQGPYQYTWSPATGLSATNVANPVCTVNSTTQYTVTVTDANNVTATDQINVNVSAAASAGVTLQSPAIASQFGGFTTYSLCDPSLSWNFGIDDASTGVAPGATLTVNWGDGSPNYNPSGSGWSTTHTRSEERRVGKEC